MRSIRNALIVLIAIVAVVIIGVALTCNGNDDDGDDSETPFDTPPAGTLEEGGEELQGAVDAVLVIVRQGQAAELRDRLSPALAEQVTDAQLDALASCVPEGVTLTVLDPTLEEIADDASATIEFEVTNAAGETTDVTAIWNFERSGESWLLKDLPPCPVEAP
jgi:hypothetical protein